MLAWGAVVCGVVYVVCCVLCCVFYCVCVVWGGYRGYHIMVDKKIPLLARIKKV
eukprot:NODE_5578_length_400_cov_18.641026_g4885_i0.p3 GENE.NODE_5578_length_400_cov_18.641026_g4885_i0~~NODE_5578_length_400_cov_18.641026_g4885_i0.p3  ORF type:complete len:54 (-),score=20.05 NODE_5578_length_400_cov_18.641026_g4885_i0:182-343(-)